MDEQEEKSGGAKLAFGACGGCLALIALGGFILFTLIAKTGLIGSRPINAEPTRIVDVSGVSMDKVEAELTASVLRSLSGGEARVEITEEMLTVFLRQDIEESGQAEDIDVNNTQVAIFKDGSLEIFVPVDVGGKNTALTMVIVPTLNDGKLNMDVSKVLVGKLKAPDFIANIPEKSINESINGQLEKYSNKIQLTGLIFKEGLLTLTGKVSLDQMIGI